ncbi:hypothetical protein BN2475_730011 [Paraburkholderia ribeironis]|uniref:Uncharacterized protein n=1 Tax=Paraburkholderia ribeironis TaxID=1247936 RepID=A0A1N7SJD2_9BURK|nr:hypothetical protein BN2475_730011 [Paraburkholderia ribeironis]
MNSRRNTMPSTRARTCATRKALVRPGSSVTTGTVVGWRVTTPTSGACGGGADCFGPHAASNTAAVAALIKRNGTRSTRMERPLSKTENEKVRASLPRGTTAHTCVLRRLTGSPWNCQSHLQGIVLGNAPYRGMPHGATHWGKAQERLKAIVTDINRSSQLGLSDRGVLLYIHSRMHVKVHLHLVWARGRKIAHKKRSTVDGFSSG